MKMITLLIPTDDSRFTGLLLKLTVRKYCIFICFEAKCRCSWGLIVGNNNLKHFGWRGTVSISTLTSHLDNCTIL